MKKNKGDLYQSYNINTFRSLMKIIEKISYEKGLPVGKLINYAIDNELDTANPFNYSIRLPVVKLTEDNIYGGMIASKVWQFMRKNFRSGVGVDTLLLLRRDIGIESKADLLFGFAELIEARLVEQCRSKNYVYGADYICYKPLELHNERIER